MTVNKKGCPVYTAGRPFLFGVKDLMNRLSLDELTCRKGRELYTVSMRPVGGERVSMQTDGNLGQIMSGMSTLFDAIRVMQHGGRMKPQTPLRGTVELSQFWIEPLVVWPYRWQLTMAAQGYTYAANIEPDLEMVLLAFQGAMTFFALKTGVITLEADVVRNRDRAGELGLLTAEGHA